MGSVGKLAIEGGSISVDNQMVVGINGEGAVIQNDGIVEIAQSIVLGQNPDSLGSYALNGGTLNIHSGSISLSDSDAAFEFKGGTLNVGIFDGLLANQGGILAPGASAGRTLINGDYEQWENAALEIEIGGPAAGFNFDDVVISGAASLAGVINVSLLSNFIPNVGQQFTILTANDGIVNNGFMLGGAAADFFSLIVGSHSVILQAIATGLPGDYNNNGTVDAADYVVWRDGLGTIYTQDDYNVWRANFGRTSGSGANVEMTAHAAVPEPTSLLLFLMAIAAIASRRCR